MQDTGTLNPLPPTPVLPEIPQAPADRLSNKNAPEKLPKFAKCTGFQSELRRRVDEYFAKTGKRERDCPAMYLKTLIIFAFVVTSYCLLVFASPPWWLAIPLALSAGMGIAGVGFNIQHDGGHRGYSDHPWINKLMAISLDFVGGSSYVWNWKHDVIHHTYVNITGHDSDIDLAPLGRLTPHQPLYSFHRWQHYYMWPLYGLASLKWQYFDDFRDIFSGYIGSQRFPRPKGWDLAIFLIGKAWFFTVTIGLPLLFHPLWMVLAFLVGTSMVVGVTLSIVFQLAHCVEEAEFPMPEEETGRIENAWAIHQLENTVDFGRKNPFLTWVLGGLNFQIEHHLFPRICHIHYPALSKVVEQTCHEYGVRYLEHKTFWAGLASHYRWLRRMGTGNL